MFSGSVNRLSSRSSPAAPWFCPGLMLAGYDEVLSIEHEDLLLPPECHVAVNEGLLQSRCKLRVPDRSSC
jgi:hypothetical protein